MKFSAKTEYGILAVLELALHYGEATIQAKSISKNQKIPLRFLEQVLGNLRKAGIVDSIRGAQGGYALSRAPAEITMGDIVKAIEGPMVSATCVLEGESGYCNHQIEYGVCDLKPIWENVRAAISETLDSITVEALCQRRKAREQQKTFMYHI